MLAASGGVRRWPGSQSAAMVSHRPNSLHASSPNAGRHMRGSGHAAEDGAAPERVHLLPAGEIRTGDGRGRYHIRTAAVLMAASLSAGDRLPIDEDHATDLAVPRVE